MFNKNFYETMNLTTLKTGLFGEVVEKLFRFFEIPELFDK